LALGLLERWALLYPEDWDTSMLASVGQLGRRVAPRDGLHAEARALLVALEAATNHKPATLPRCVYDKLADGGGSGALVGYDLEGFVWGLSGGLLAEQLTLLGSGIFRSIG